MKKKTGTVSRKGKKIRAIIFWIILAAFLVWFAALKINLTSTSDSYDYVIPFGKRDVSSYRTLSGRVVMADIESVSSEVTQKIKKVNYKLGDYVSEGDILCEFESEDLDEKIARLEKIIADRNAVSELENSSEAAGNAAFERTQQLALESAQLAVDSARKDYDDTYNRYQEYYDKFYATSNPDEQSMYYEMLNKYASELEPINDRIRAAQKELENTRREVSRAREEKESSDYIRSFSVSETAGYEKQLEKLRKEKEGLVVKSPKSGIISECLAVEGSYAFDGCLFRIGNMGKYKIEALAPEKDILSFEKGMKADFTTVLTEDKVIPADVRKISDVMSVQSMASGYTVELEIGDDSCSSSLRPNIDAIVRIYDYKSEPVDAVQYDAIFSDDDGDYVYRAVKKGTEYVAEKVKVEKGYESDFYVEVKSEELKEGDLIVGNASEHRPGETLKIKGMAG